MLCLLPNALSISRIPLSFGLFYYAMLGQWRTASLLLAIALLTDMLDGTIARRFHVESQIGGKWLEPISDFSVAASSIAGLAVRGKISAQTVVLAVVGAVLLQVAHSLPWKSVRRHAYYLHPLLFVGVMWVVGIVYLLLSLNEARFNELVFVTVVGVYTGLWVAIGWFKRRRVRTWLQGPPEPT